MKSITALRLVSILVLLVTLTACTSEQQDTVEVKPYPLETCLVSDEKLWEDPDMKPYTFVVEGQEVTLCCKGCLKSFDKEPGKYLAKLQAPSPSVSE